MGTTPNRGFPYPEGTDFVASGDDAIQALAEAVDDRLAGHSYVFGSGSGPAGIPSGGDTITWDLGSAAGWHLEADEQFIYDGPARWHLVTATVVLAVASFAFDTTGDWYHTHAFAVPMYLTPGTYVQVEASAAPSGQFYTGSFRAFSLGASPS